MRMLRTRQLTQKKTHGAHFTPYELACFVARRIINAVSLDSVDSVRVLDPACGDGELLLAFAEILPAEYLERMVFVGVESDEKSLARARSRLEQRSLKQLEFVHGDFLKLCIKNTVQPNLLADLSATTLLGKPVDIIIANPPYVRTQTLGSEKSQELAASFGLTGRVDLYQAFLVAMTRQLTSGGVLGVITSNRFLSTQGGASVRELMLSEYDIIELIDLGDTRLFEAAVLPAIFVGRKLASSLRAAPSSRSTAYYIQRSGRGGDARFVRIYELTGNSKDAFSKKDSLEPCKSVYSVLDMGKDGDYFVSGQCFRVSTGALSFPQSADEPWSMVTANEGAWLDVIKDHTKLQINDVAKVRVGIKTTADEVFIRSDWDSLPEEVRPEKELLHVLLSHDNAERWIVNQKQSQIRRILYTHIIKNGKRVAIDLRQYPGASAYLEQHRERLSGRTYVLEAKRNWFEIWVPQQPSLWKLPKLVFPDISPQPKFHYDERGFLVDGNCYWITLDEFQSPDLLFLIAGVANSHLLTRYHEIVFNNKLYAGRRRYLTQYVEKYPLPDPLMYQSHEIVNVVKDLIFSSLPDNMRIQKERDLEVLVAQAFGVEPVFSIKERT